MSDDGMCGWSADFGARLRRINRELGTDLVVEGVGDACSVIVIDRGSRLILTFNDRRGRSPKVLKDWLRFAEAVLVAGRRAKARQMEVRHG